MFTGIHLPDYWIEQRDGFLRTLLSNFPEIFLGHYLINTSFDSGSLILTDNELERGWQKHGGLSLSPLISNVTEIPYDQFDEWYIFNTLPAFTTFNKYKVFVNHGGFSLQASIYRELQETFWDQLEIIMPETYVAEGDNLLLVTKNLHLYEKLKAG